jgi:RND superfamily putative drug exporter
MSLSGALYRLGRFSVRRRRWVLGVWVVSALGILLAGRALGVTSIDEFRVPGAESQQALDLLKERFPAASGTEATVVFHAADGKLVEPPHVATIEETLGRVATLPHVMGIESPLGAAPGGRAGVSPDGSIAFATVHFDADASTLGAETVEELEAAIAPADRSGTQVELGGALLQAVDRAEPRSSEMIGLIAAVLVLLFAFGSVVAMGLPIGTAIVGLLTGMSLVRLLSVVVDMPTVAPTLATMIGLGVGIDYALFIVTRHRGYLAEGHTVEDAAGRAIATSGQAVVVAGATVVVAILGLWLSGIPFVGLLGTASAIVVTVAVLAAITVLPAFLGFAGRSIDRFRVPALFGGEGARTGGASPGWTRFGTHVVSQPWRHLMLSLVILGLLTVPLFSMRLGQVDAGTSPRSTTQRRAYDLMTQGFGPGFNGPLLLSVDGASEPALAVIGDAVATDPGVAVVKPAMSSPDGATAVLTVVPSSSPQSAATTDLVARLRSDVLPVATEGTGARVYVGGQTATYIDLADKVGRALPVFIGAVVLMSFLLLMVVFRSIAVPLKAALLNLLSIGAAYGVVVAIFQWGWGKGLVGLEETVPIVSFVPMMMFAILFGLSMDYEVFLLSRIREEYLDSGDNDTSIVAGMATTARVITSAALIMVAVFLSFLLQDDPTVKMVGIGLATAVAVDATLVRMVLVPSSMALMGRWNWWLPAWLERVLPRLDIESEAALPRAELEPAASPEEREGVLIAGG